MDYRVEALPHIIGGDYEVVDVIQSPHLTEPDYDQFSACFKEHVFFEVSPSIKNIISKAPDFETEPPRPSLNLDGQQLGESAELTQATILWCAWYLCQWPARRLKLQVIAKTLALKLLIHFYESGNLPFKQPERQLRCGTVIFNASNKGHKEMRVRHDIEDHKMLAWFCAHIAELDLNDEKLWRSICLSAGQCLLKFGHARLHISEISTDVSVSVVFGEKEKNELSALREQSIKDLQDRTEVTRMECHSGFGRAAHIPKRPITYAEFESGQWA
ncbi:MAG: hypothetical protein COB59_12220 [Rhodospirillaceae bacterium]|nr:MAG: hypothetical protein COB59_12220 [Rhodospirillaceae bacterium]